VRPKPTENAEVLGNPPQHGLGWRGGGPGARTKKSQALPQACTPNPASAWQLQLKSRLLPALVQLPAGVHPAGKGAGCSGRPVLCHAARAGAGEERGLVIILAADAAAAVSSTAFPSRMHAGVDQMLPRFITFPHLAFAQRCKMFFDLAILASLLPPSAQDPFVDFAHSDTLARHAVIMGWLTLLKVLHERELPVGDAVEALAQALAYLADELAQAILVLDGLVRVSKS
jgi:hypothetical protein